MSLQSYRNIWAMSSKPRINFTNIGVAIV
jgi:hypothetical protein